MPEHTHLRIATPKTTHLINLARVAIITWAPRPETYLPSDLTPEPELTFNAAGGASLQLRGGAAITTAKALGLVRPPAGGAAVEATLVSYAPTPTTARDLPEDEAILDQPAEPRQPYDL